MPNDLLELLPSVRSIAQSAGQAALAFYRSKTLEVFKKLDQTPVTSADRAAHRVIAQELSQLADWPVLSEEGEIPPYALRRGWSRYWLCDPLDGTRGFIQGGREFVVNIALIEHSRPILGVIYKPVDRLLFFAYRGGGAYQCKESSQPQALRVAKRRFDQLRFVIGRYQTTRHIQTVLEAIPQARLFRLNSAMKFIALSQGRADVYASFGCISEWDIAAGQCILEEAGGAVLDFSERILAYNRRTSLLCPAFLALSDTEHVKVLMQLFKRGF